MTLSAANSRILLIEAPFATSETNPDAKVKGYVDVPEVAAV